MSGTIRKRCYCPIARHEDGSIVKDEAGKSVREHRKGCRPTWSITFDVAPKGAKRKQKGASFRTRREAEAALTAAQQELNTGTYFDTGRMTVGDYLESWLRGKLDIRPSTRRSYGGHIHHHLIPELGQIRLTELRHTHVAQAFANIGAKDRVGPTTLHRIHATLNSAMNDAVRRHILSVNHARYVDLPSARPREMTVWTPRELRTFLNDVDDDDRDAALFYLIAFTGLRRGETLGLKWRDVELDVGLLHVRQQLTLDGSALTEGPPKSSKGVRTIYLDDETIQQLRRWNFAQAAEHLLLDQQPTLVFTRPDGRPLAPDYIYRRFIRRSASIGLPRIRLHDLRHTHASHALAAGVPLKVVSERLGHSDLALTANTYTHVLPTVAQEAAQIIAKLALEAEPLLANREPPAHPTVPSDEGSAKKDQVKAGGPPGTRTLNLRIKSPGGDRPQDDQASTQ